MHTLTIMMSSNKILNRWQRNFYNIINIMSKEMEILDKKIEIFDVKLKWMKKASLIH